MSKKAPAQTDPDSAATRAVEAISKRDAEAFKALVLVDTSDGDQPGKSQAITEDPWEALILDGQVIAPPFDPLWLSTLYEINTELEPIFDALCTNVEAMGWRLRCLVDPKKLAEDEQLQSDVRAEHAKLYNFFEHLHPQDSFIDLRCKRRRDYEQTGYSGWEVIRSPITGEMQGFEHLPSFQLRLGKQMEPYETEVPVRILKEDGSYEPGTKRMFVRFRLHVQYAISPVQGQQVSFTGFKYRYFKEFGDPRVYNVTTGEEISPEKVADWDGEGHPMPQCLRANEVAFWHRYVGRTPYGLPRHIGNLLGIFGSRAAESANFYTLRCNSIPAMMILVSQGQLTDATITRIKEFAEASVEGRNNYGRFLLIEAEGEDEGDEPGQVKMDVKPVQSSQITDALYGKYRKSGQEEVRRAYRMPPIFLGATEDYSRAVVDTSRSVGDEQVFAPKRNKFDWWVNHRLFPAMKLGGKEGVRYHEFVTNSPNTTDNQELVRILSGAEKTGGMTPRIARKLLEDIFGAELPPFPEDFDQDVPFSLTMANAVKNQADPTEPGQQVTALKLLLGDDADTLEGVAALSALQERLEKLWRSQLKVDE